MSTVSTKGLIDRLQRWLVQGYGSVSSLWVDAVVKTNDVQPSLQVLKVCIFDLL